MVGVETRVPKTVHRFSSRTTSAGNFPGQAHEQFSQSATPFRLLLARFTVRIEVRRGVARLTHLRFADQLEFRLLCLGGWGLPNGSRFTAPRTSQRLVAHSLPGYSPRRSSHRGSRGLSCSDACYRPGRSRLDRLVRRSVDIVRLPGDSRNVENPPVLQEPLSRMSFHGGPALPVIDGIEMGIESGAR
jgi:hypothetical protein